MNSITIFKAKGLRGEIRVPGDKSISHRAVMLGSIAKGTTQVEGFLPGEDCVRTVNALRQMGVNITAPNPQELVIHGQGLRGLKPPANTIYVGNSGTSMRLLSGILAEQKFKSLMDGDASLRSRPMGRVITPLKEMGADVWAQREGKYPPLHFSPTAALNGVNYTSPIASAQVKSAILLAGLYAEGETKVTEPAKSRDHTERMFKQFGVPITIEDLAVSICGQADNALCGQNIIIPGDFSGAAFFMVAGLIVPNSEIVIKGVGINSTRTGLLEVLQQMGGEIELVNKNEQLAEPIADIYVRSSLLRGFSLPPEVVPRMIDEFPILCIAAALAEGTTTITGAKELRVKETDRICSMAEGLRKMGVKVEEFEDGMQIEGQQVLNGAKCRSHGDHRTAMSWAIAGLVAQGETEIANIDCIATSFPGFFDLLDSLKSKG